MCRAVRQVLELSQLPKTLPAQIRTSPLYLSTAAQLRSRSLLRSLLALSDDELLAAGGTELARSIFEHVTTALWVLEDPDQASEAFGRAHIKTLRQLSEGDDAFRPMFDDSLRRWRTAYGSAPSEGKLPSLESRLVGPVRDWYFRYRVLSSYVHPSLLAYDTHYRVTEGAEYVETLQLSSDDYLDGMQLPLGGVLTASLALVVHGELGLKAQLPELASLATELNSYVVEGYRSLRTRYDLR